jgi:hypothetical protein
VQLDISRAFDMVPHQSIGPALRRKGLHEHVVRLVENSYKDVHTTIHQGTVTTSIKLLRGVKQGDPLSPLLFNLVTEPLLLALETTPGFTLDDGNNLSCLAFADDLILLADSAPQARGLLKTTEEYLDSLDMKVQAAKCLTFEIKPAKEAWCIQDPGLSLKSGGRIPFAGPESKLKYLGAHISPWNGVILGGIRESINECIGRVKRLALKPHQKIQLISTYLVPHYIYPLVLGIAPVTRLREIDRDIRVAVKEILHLPLCVTDGFIYAGKRNGGLGFPKLETVVATTSLTEGIKFMHSPDPIIKSLAASLNLGNKLRRIAQALRLPWPSSIAEVRRHKRRLKRDEVAKWGSSSTQGRGVHAHLDDPIGNQFLYAPHLLKPGRYCSALKLRTNTAPTKIALQRAHPRADVSCRLCKTLPETLGHVVGQCTATKEARIRRHDEVVDIVINRLSNDQDVTIVKEAKIQTETVAKPDILVKRDDRVFVVDVTIRHEDGDSMANGRNDKFEKYNKLVPVCCELLGASHGQVVPIVIGTRGAMPKQTQEDLRTIGIRDRKTLLTISLTSLRNTIEIFHQFMDYTPKVEPTDRGPPSYVDNLGNRT